MANKIKLFQISDIHWMKTQVVKIIQSYEGIVNKMVWRKF